MRPILIIFYISHVFDLSAMDIYVICYEIQIR